MVKASSSVKVNPKPIPYFLYNKPYGVMECPNKKALNALKTLLSKTNNPMEEEGGWN